MHVRRALSGAKPLRMIMSAFLLQRERLQPWTMPMRLRTFQKPAEPMALIHACQGLCGAPLLLQIMFVLPRSAGMKPPQTMQKRQNTAHLRILTVPTPANKDMSGGKQFVTIMCVCRQPREQKQLQITPALLPANQKMAEYPDLTHA